MDKPESTVRHYARRAGGATMEVRETETSPRVLSNRLRSSTRRRREGHAAQELAARGAPRGARAADVAGRRGCGRRGEWQGQEQAERQAEQRPGQQADGQADPRDRYLRELQRRQTDCSA